ncbi:MAG: GxxExxY protein [Planctomycetales bacterium]|nr:GxxExxY protein [Planctomycetales bacterium]
MGVSDLPYSELTGRIIEAAYEVYNEMGCGFLESVYEKCLTIALRTRGINALTQTPIDVCFRGELVGHFVADLVVEGIVIVELKAVRTLTEAHEVQLVNYLVATNKPVGLLLNFGPKGVDVKRKVPQLPASQP